MSCKLYTSLFITTDNVLSVLREKAGKAELGVKIKGPQSRASVPFNITPTQRGDHVTYVVKQTGTYVIDVTYGRLTVPGTYDDV